MVEMTDLEEKLFELSKDHPQRHASLTILDFYKFQAITPANDDDLIEYLQYRYTTEKPKCFVDWYTGRLPKNYYNWLEQSRMSRCPRE